MKTEPSFPQEKVRIPRSFWFGPIWSELLLALLPFILFLCIYKQLPDRFAIHFGANGVADDFADKNSSSLWYLIIQPGIFVFIVMKAMRILSIFLLSRSGKTADQGNNLKLAAKVMTYAEFTVIIIPSVVIFFVLNMALSPSDFVLNDNFLGRIIFAIISILIILTGNLFPKIRPNKWFGIKTPYAFTSEEAWVRTQRFGGKLLVWMGILNLSATLTPAPFLFRVFFFLGTLILSTVIIYIWKPGNKKTQQQL